MKILTINGRPWPMYLPIITTDPITAHIRETEYVIPSQTYRVIGGDAAIKAAESHDPVGDYVVMGVELNDLAALAVRLNSAMTDANELRDWQNRINLIIDRAECVRTFEGVNGGKR